MKTEKEVFALVDKLREISFSLHNYLRHGHLEKVYENGLVHRGRKAGIKLEKQFPLKVYDEDGTILGDYVADLFVEKCLLVELKAVRKLADDHVAQLLGYMRACKIEHGLLVNFGSSKLEIKKYILWMSLDYFAPLAPFCGKERMLVLNRKYLFLLINFGAARLKIKKYILSELS